jgi:predicted nucleic acid-binding protein
VLVVDASVVAPAVADSGIDGDAVRRRLRGESLAGPDLLRIEAMSVIRRAAVNGSLSAAQARRAVDDLLDIPLVVYPTTPLLRRAWRLRNNLTPYDACYVALAEALGCTLLTADARLANAPGSRCPIEVI